MTDTRPRNAAQLIQACIENPLLAARCFEKFYITAKIIWSDPEAARLFEQSRPVVEALADIANFEESRPKDAPYFNFHPSFMVTKDCPIIVEPRAMELADEILSPKAKRITKAEARVYNGLTNPFTLVSDNVVMVTIEGQEPAILVAVRDANAPSPFTECLPGGWVGPADFLRTAQVKLDNEIAFSVPGLGRKTFSQLQDIGMARVDQPANGLMLKNGVKPERRAYTGNYVFFHQAAKPDFADDANMLNLLCVVNVTLPKGSTVEDATGFGRMIDLVPLSEFAKDRGRPTLPTVDFVRDTLLPWLRP